MRQSLPLIRLVAFNQENDVRDYKVQRTRGEKWRDFDFAPLTIPHQRFTLFTSDSPRDLARSLSVDTLGVSTPRKDHEEDRGVALGLLALIS